MRAWPVKHGFQYPDFINLFEVGKRGALLLDLIENLLGKEVEMFALEDQNPLIRRGRDQLRHFLLERFLHDHAEIGVHLLSSSLKRAGSAVSQRRNLDRKRDFTCRITRYVGNWAALAGLAVWQRSKIGPQPRRKASSLAFRAGGLRPFSVPTGINILV